MKYIAILLLTLVLLMGLAPVALADGIGVTLQNPLCLSGGGSNCISDFPQLINKVKDFVVGLIASLSVIMFVWAGILFVTAGANPSNVEKAKKAALYAIIGVAVALAADGLLSVITAVIGTGGGE